MASLLCDSISTSDWTLLNYCHSRMCSLPKNSLLIKNFNLFCFTSGGRIIVSYSVKMVILLFEVLYLKNVQVSLLSFNFSLIFLINSIHIHSMILLGIFPSDHLGEFSRNSVWLESRTNLNREQVGGWWVLNAVLQSAFLILRSTDHH